MNYRNSTLYYLYSPIEICFIEDVHLSYVTQTRFYEASHDILIYFPTLNFIYFLFI